MAEEKKSLAQQFMEKGGVTAYEGGLDKPDHLQQRPFFGLLPQGKTTFIEKGDKDMSYDISTLEDKMQSQSLTTEAHDFVQNLEKRFRNVVPGITVFVIDPDAIKGHYLMDHGADRSLQKSLYMYVEDKLQKANAGNKKTFLANEDVLNMVSESVLTGRNPFSMRAGISPTYAHIEGMGAVNLVLPDNPDSMAPNVLGDAVYGADERMIREGITPDEFRRLVVYHELGHSTDRNYCGYTFKKITQNSLSDVMDRHRTECIADAHAVMQLARDFGEEGLKCAALWGDCRIEYLRVCVDRRLEDTKYETEFFKKMREEIEKTTGENPDDPKWEAEYKKLMADKDTAKVIDQLGSPLAYHTTDVVDATIAYAREALKDGSLQKMTDAEVIAKAQYMSETYGLTRQQMAELSISLAEGKEHPKYHEMMERCSEARDHMVGGDITREDIDKHYEVEREKMAYVEAVKFAASLGLPKPDFKMSDELKAELKAQAVARKQYEVEGGAELDGYASAVLDALDENNADRETMHALISQQKEALREAGHDYENPDKFAEDKLQFLDSVIEQAPAIEAMVAGSKIVKDQIAAVKTDTEVKGDDAIAHFVKNELKSLAAMQSAFISAANRDPQSMTLEEQYKAMAQENRDFKKAIAAEKETQVAAFAIRSDKEAWAKVSKDPVLSMLVEAKAKQKPTEFLAQYQMQAGAPDQASVIELAQGAAAYHQAVVVSVVRSPEVKSVIAAKEPRMMAGVVKAVKEMKAMGKEAPVEIKTESQLHKIAHEQVKSTLVQKQLKDKLTGRA